MIGIPRLHKMKPRNNNSRLFPQLARRCGADNPQLAKAVSLRNRGTEKVSAGLTPRTTFAGGWSIVRRTKENRAAGRASHPYKLRFGGAFLFFLHQYSRISTDQN